MITNKEQIKITDKTEHTAKTVHQFHHGSSKISIRKEVVYFGHTLLVLIKLEEILARVSRPH